LDAFLKLTVGQTRRMVSQEDAMATAKEEVAELLQRLPDDCTLEDIQYHLYVLEKIRRGLDDADAGRVQSQSQIEARFGEWLDK
jgi:hypothetical protein